MIVYFVYSALVHEIDAEKIQFALLHMRILFCLKIYCFLGAHTFREGEVLE